MLAPRSTSQTGGPSLVGCPCLFNILAATLQIGGRSSISKPEDSPCRGDRDPLITEEKYIVSQWISLKKKGIPLHRSFIQHLLYPVHANRARRGKRNITPGVKCGLLRCGPIVYVSLTAVSCGGGEEGGQQDDCCAWARAEPRLSTTECYKTMIMFPGKNICISSTDLADVTEFQNSKSGKFKNSIRNNDIWLVFRTELWCHGGGYFLISQ
jgi:hypothetical protein